VGLTTSGFRNMHIAFFQVGQLESLIDLMQDMSRHYNGVYASERAAIQANLLERVLGPDSGVKLLLASVEGRVVGMASVALLYPAPKEHGQLQMKELYVVSDYRSRGVGRALMLWLARYAVAQRCGRFDWTAEASNTGALAFYEELGARHVTEKRYYRLADDALQALAAQAERERPGE